jgi:predicted nucleotidyltransferase component of viral defense system
VPIGARRSVELFHLAFLRALTAKGEDKSLIALKGGCNLRFYFGSTRYSEDIDFDVSVIAKGTLSRKVDRLLASPLLVAPLKSKGIEIIDASAPKQTETTQRWKVGLRAAGIEMPLRTKIEFSRRDAITGALFESIDVEVTRAHALTPTLASHYGAPAAIAQKIHALAGRAESQPRDVFDLNLLFARPEAQNSKLSPAQRRWVPEAIDRAMSMSFDAYRSKVIAYLDPEQRALYEAKSAWDAMQEAVVSQLEGLR